MLREIRLAFCAGFLLFAALGCAASAFAQKAGANPNAKQTAHPPVVRQVKNLSQQRRQAAMNELAAAIEARMKVDPQYRAYIKAVDQHNKNADAFAKAHKGGAR